MNVVTLKQRTPEWHEWRATHVTASEVAVVMGISKYKTAYELFLEKTGRKDPEDLSANPHVQRGVANEPEARRLAEDALDTLLLPVVAESEAYPYIGASFDGVSEDGVPVELKCPAQSGFDEVVEKGVDSEQVARYLPQLHCQMLVADATEGYLGFLSPDCQDFVLLHFHRDETLIKALLEAAEAFNTCLVNDTPPKRDPERDYFVPTGDQLDAWDALAQRYRETSAQVEAIKARLKPLEKQLDAFKGALVDQMGDFDLAELCGVRVKVSHIEGKPDYQKVIEALGIEVPEDVLLENKKKDSVRTTVTVTERVMPTGVKELVMTDEEAQAADASKSRKKIDLSK